MNDAIPFSTVPHDHQNCIDTALDEAAELCARRGVRLTQVRRRVLELIWDGHQAAGAYAILDALREENHRAAPPTVYRALEFLSAHGLIHRIESLNAYIGCVRPDHDHAGQFLICESCGATAELHDQRIARAVGEGAHRAGFQALRQTVEVAGLCPDCHRRTEAG
jgi:Fur family zinc uptake transcriptional regulator